CDGEEGCYLRERCKNCNQTEHKLTTEGCIKYCQECNETWGETKGCDPNVEHDIIFKEDPNDMKLD
ncbi:16099_t:CDS:1, partial [Acaulospora morrowiae]